MENTVGDGASPPRRWFAGPARNRRLYEVSDIESLAGGRNTVVAAMRRPAPDDPCPYAGSVALKLQDPVGDADLRTAADRLERIAAIDHPNLGRPIETFLGSGLLPDGAEADRDDDVMYTASVWEDGCPLSAAIPLPPERALGVLRGVAGAVTALHDAGLAHRDLHPGNVIIRPDGSVVVIDFGTVRPDDGAHTATVAGVVGFIPPDRVNGGNRRDDDRWCVGMLGVAALLGHPQGRMPVGELRAELATALASAADPGEAVQAIVAATHPDFTRRPPLAEWLDRFERGLSVKRRTARRRRAVLLGAAATIAAVAAGGLWLANDDGSNRPAGASGEALVATTAVPDAALSLMAEQDATDPAATPVMRKEAETTPAPPATLGAAPSTTAATSSAVDPEPCADPLEGHVVTGEPPRGACLSGDEYALVDGVVRDVTVDGDDAGVVVTPPGGTPLYLPAAVWTSYLEIAGRNQPANSVNYGGYPIAFERIGEPDAVVLHLSSGGLLIGPRDDTQLFWIPAQAVELWNELGGRTGSLGFPSANLRVLGERATVEFAHGAMSVPADQVAAALAGAPIDITVDQVDDAAATLPDPRPVEVILRQWNGTSWWIDAAGVRHWISDGGTWECLGGQDAVAADELAGWTVWVFPLGDPARC